MIGCACLAASAVAHAQPGLAPAVPIVDEDPTWNVGAHGGAGYLVRKGDDDASGAHAAGGLELGRYVRPDLSLQMMLAVNPPLSPYRGLGSDGAEDLTSFFGAAVFEYHVGTHFIGAGGGVAMEVVNNRSWNYDLIGPTDWNNNVELRVGAIAVARAGFQHDLIDRLSILVMVQGVAMALTGEQLELGYGGSLEAGVRYRW